MRADNILASIEATRDKGELLNVVNNFARNVGMDGAYIIHFHPAAGLTLADNRPEEWLDHYGKEGYLHFDPIAYRAFCGGESFTWDDCIAKSRLSKDQKLLLHQARDFGLNQGYNTVANTDDYSAATCCFYNKHSGDFFATMQENKPLLEQVGHAAQDQLSAFVRDTFNLPRLTEQQIKCLTEAARGATSEVIGQLFGISKNTVDTHIKAASKKLGVRTKIQAVSLAIQLKLIFPIKFTTLY